MGADLAVVLAPVLAAAAGVERMLETIFNTLEGMWRKAVAYLGYGMRWLKAAETEVDDARQWLQNASTLYNGIMAGSNEQVKEVLKGLNASTQVAQLPEQIAAEVNRLKNEADDKAAAAKAMLADAPEQLDIARKALGSLTDSAEYKSAKSAASIILGLMLGVVVAASGQIQMFAMLGIAAVPASADVLITGLVIGSGTYPVHSLVGILQQSKDTLDSIKGFFNQSAPQQKSTMHSGDTEKCRYWWRDSDCDDDGAVDGGNAEPVSDWSGRSAGVFRLYKKTGLSARPVFVVCYRSFGNLSCAWIVLRSDARDR